MRFFIKFFSFLLAITIVLVSAPTIRAENVKTITTENYTEDIYEPLEKESAPVSSAADLQITSKSAILVEETTGEIIFEHNSHEKLSPASVTKIMSLILIMEAIERQDITLETVITTSEHANSMGGSQIWLKVGEKMSVDDLLKATVIASANDATVALAEAVSGSEESFVALMNERAKSLGMNDTTFKNATGLDAEGHLTSAYDIALMSRELLKYDLIKTYSTVWMDTLRGGASELVNTNKLVRFYEGATGLKTGTTSKAGYCLSASATRDGLSLIAVVMDAPSSKVRFNEARTLLSFGFANYTFMEFTVPEEELTPIKVNKGAAQFIIPKAESTAKFLIPKIEKDNITHVTEIRDELAAPIEKGTQVGIARIMLGDKEIATVKIVSPESVKEMTFLRSFLLLLKQMAVI